MNDYVLDLGNLKADLSTVGGKGAALAEMVRAGLPVPEGFHVTTAAYRAFVAANDLDAVIAGAVAAADPDVPSTLEGAAASIAARFEGAPMPPAVAGAVAQAYAALSGAAPVVAVRSSATAEDLPDLSFAGQQETFLNIEGTEGVLQAVKRCWASLWTARAIGYRARHAVSPEQLSLAVVVQRLVPAEVAGILFTANPLNGRRDQTLINAAWGLGEAVVGGAVTPDSFVVDNQTGEVVEHDVADKLVMTVRTDGGTEERAVPDELRRAPSLTDDQLAALQDLGRQIADLYGSPRDIEFAIADGKIAVVQARPITALPEPVAAPPSDWSVPDPKGQYMRASIIDLMPDPLFPLYATLGLAGINGALQDLMRDVFGAPHGTLPEETMVTINGYAYMNAGYTPKQWVLLLWYMVPKFPRMLRTGVRYWKDDAHPAYIAKVSEWESRDPAKLTPSQLLTGVLEVTEQASKHLGSLMVSTMGPSAGAEGLFTNVYEKLVRKEGDPPAPTLLLGFDNIPLAAEKALYDLAQWSLSQPGLADYLTETPTEAIIADEAAGAVPDGVDAGAWLGWCTRFGAYLHDYGYAIYYLDFTRALPMDDPVPAVEALKLFVSGQGRSPYARQREFAERREEAVRSIRGRIRGLKSWIFEKALAWAQRQVPLREDGIAEIGLGYPVLRAMLRELGHRLVQADAIAAPDDIFWLETREIERAVGSLEKDAQPDRMVAPVEARQAAWRGRKTVTPPSMLPAKGKYLGIDVTAFTAVEDNVAGSQVIKGLGASPGRVSAPARVLHGPEDFDTMAPGDVLVASTTTPAWTPLFAMAAGVVTDIGGPLSHGSIVAREYGIPAVMGTGSATKLIRSGQVITVIGDTGEVLLENGQEKARA